MHTDTGSFEAGIRSTRDFLQVIDLDPADDQAALRLTSDLGRYGLALVRSAHFRPEVRRAFLDVFLDYLVSGLRLEKGRPVVDHAAVDLRPGLGYQYGPTPIGQEVALCTQPKTSARCRAFVDRLDARFLPRSVPGSGTADRKGRFMTHLVTHRRELSREVEDSGRVVGRLDADPVCTVLRDPANVVPGYLDEAGRRGWQSVMDDFGMMMLNPLTEISIMLARGLGLDADYFVKLMDQGHHKVAPTFASYFDHREPGTVQAALHEDIDVFAIHVAGTHPGLYVYTETGERLDVRVPEGTYLVQAGRQLYLKMRSMQRAGELGAPRDGSPRSPIQPGWHEVIVTPEALERARASIEAVETVLADSSLSDDEKLDRIRVEYRNCLRVSGTFFYHFGDETELVYALPPGTREEGVFPEGTRIARYIGLELGFIKLGADE